MRLNAGAAKGKIEAENTMQPISKMISPRARFGESRDSGVVRIIVVTKAVRAKGVRPDTIHEKGGTDSSSLKRRAAPTARIKTNGTM